LADGEGYVNSIGTTLEQPPVERIHGLQCPALIFFRLALTTDQAKELDLVDADGRAEVDGVPVPATDRWLTRPSCKNDRERSVPAQLCRCSPVVTWLGGNRSPHDTLGRAHNA